MPLMVSISGIRGIVGESLTPDIAIRYAAAFGRYCTPASGHAPTIVVGRDGRATGGIFTDIIVAALRATGARVVSLGISPTPTIQLAVEHIGAAGGISVTASHNPMQWNGMKFVAPTGMFLDAEENARLWALADEPQAYVPWDRLGGMSVETEWLQRHIEHVLSLPYLDVPSLRRRRLRVVADCINASGGLIVPPLLSALGCEVIPLNCEVSGVFRRAPEPVPENLEEAAAAVRAEHADVGLVVDPDVDRLVLITEQGIPFGEEYTVTSAVRFVLGKLAASGGTGPATVVVNLSTTRAVDEVSRQFGATVMRTPVGEINVAKKMKEVGAAIGGEGSGGVILPDVHLGRDAIVGIGLLLQYLADSGTTLSELKATLPQFSIAKGKSEIRSGSPDAALAGILERHGSSGRTTTADGVKIDFEDSWVHLRKSNTEPIVRIIAEARSMREAEAIVRRFTTELSGTA
jgi:phosphomannomutase